MTGTKGEKDNPLEIVYYGMNSKLKKRENFWGDGKN